MHARTPLKTPRSWVKKIRKLERLLPDEAKKEAIVELPSGQRVSLVEARERLVERDAWLGIKSMQMKARLEKQLQEFQLLQEANDLARSGLGVQEIARRLGVSRTAVTNWLEREILPRSLSERRFEGFKRRRKQVNITPDKHADLSYIFGILFGEHLRRKPEGKEGSRGLGFFFSIKDQSLGEEIKKRLERVTGSKTLNYRVNNFNVHGFIARNFTQLVNRETSYLSKLPKRFLSSRRERLLFLRGLFDSNGQVKRMKVGVKAVTLTIQNPELLEFTLSNLNRFQIPHTIETEKIHGKTVQLIVIWPKDFNRFKQLIGFRGKSKQDLLG